MSNPRDWSLSIKLAIAVGAGFFALFLVLALLSLRAVDDSTKRILEERRALTVEAAASIDSFLEQAFYELEKATTFAPFDPTAADLSAEAHMLAHAYGRVGSFALGVSFLDARGRIVLSEPFDPDLIGADLSMMPHISEALITGRRSVSTPHRHRGTMKPTVALTVPIKDKQGRIIGLLSGLIDTMNSPLSRTIEVARRLGRTGHAEIIDRQLMVVASTDLEDVLEHGEHASFYARLLAEGRTDVASTLYEEGSAKSEWHIMAFAPLQAAPWGVAMGGDEGETLAPVRELRTGLLLLGILSLVVLLGMTLYATRYLLRPLGELSAAAERVTAGDLDSRIGLPPSSEPSSEIVVLANSLETMRAKLAGSLVEIRGWNRDLEERVALRTRELERRNRELAISASIAATVSAAFDMEEVLRSALDAVMGIVGLEAGAIRLLDPESGALVLRVHRGLPEGYVREMAQVAPDHCRCGQVCATSRPAIVTHLSDLPSDGGDACQVLGVCCLAIVPLESKNRLQGLLYLGSNDCERFGQVFGGDVTSLLTSMGHQLGVAIENALLYEELQRKEEHRRHLLERVIAAQEDERKRIARELHDETGQALTALMMNLEAIAEVIPVGHKEVRGRLERMESILTQSIEEIRTIILDLRPTALDDLGLVPALRRYAESHLDAQGVVVEIDATGLRERLAPHLETVLFRIVQEAINNVSRHAGASAVQVTLSQNDDHVLVEIADNGRGFDQTALPHDGNAMRGLGLLGMEERAALIGGVCRVISTPGRGTRVSVVLPIITPEVLV